MDWCLSAWHPAFVTGVFWGYHRTPAADRDWPAIEASVRRCAELMAIVEGELRGHDYLTGVELGLGEIPLGTALYRYFELDIDRPALPRVEAWYDRLRRRPAYREHVMTPFDDLKGRLAF
jgi:glutathione S-transferase